ncbi:MAG TPA: ABC transporter substrate-binding protein [Solirubrobacteraceae bacterium]|nr:ABC transporter substrate-binding protein [Solirubrobacteraceae bacterium]
MQKAALAALAAVLLAGCGEIKNTITPSPGSANQITVALAGQPNAFYAGIYEAQALGLFRQTDLNVHLVIPSAGVDPLTMVHNGQVLIAISSEPNVLLHRNEDQPVVGVAAIVHAPLQTITITAPKGGPSGGAGVGTATKTTATRTRTTRTKRPTHTTTTSTTTVPTTTTVSDPGAPRWPASLQQLLSKPGYPTYNGLEIVVRKNSIVNEAPLLRRFVQAVARGYRAARANPAQAITNLVTAVPSLAPQQPLETAMLQAALPYIFPSGLKVFGYQRAAQWNAFGSWLTDNHLLSNPNAISDASTNELLPAQGV